MLGDGGWWAGHGAGGTDATGRLSAEATDSRLMVCSAGGSPAEWKSGVVGNEARLLVSLWKWAA